MTKQEAINILRDIRQDINYIYGRTCYLQEKTTTESESYKMDIEALDMAIEALDRQKGKWIEGDMLECNQCHHRMIVGGGAYNYCPNCGAKMKVV